MDNSLSIYCCECKAEVNARLTTGREIYPNRSDLYDLPFWKCDGCGSYVGCHHKTKNRTRPLGVICGTAMKNARREIHKRLDPIWQSKRMTRRAIYARLSEVLGRDYHTADLRSLEEARSICRELNTMDPHP